MSVDPSQAISSVAPSIPQESESMVVVDQDGEIELEHDEVDNEMEDGGDEVGHEMDVDDDNEGEELDEGDEGA